VQGGAQSLAKPMPLLIAKLAVSNFLPTVVGKALRELSPKKVAPWADRNKAWLGVFSNGCLAVIILQSLSGARDELLNTPLGTFLVVVLLALGYHAFFLAVNAAVLKLLRVPPPERASSLILASQKSAPVALTAIEFITADLAAQGLLSVPCVIGQLGQVFMGQPLTDALAKRNRRYEAEQKAGAEGEAASKAAVGDAEAPVLAAAAETGEGAKGGDGGTTAAPATAAAAAAASAADAKNP
jgi:solute carrier family 10 (sodium/bile acid cotransporter), member 7